MRDGGAGQRYDPLYRQSPRGEEASHIDHVLVTQVPDGAIARDRRQVVDVDARISGRMGSAEFLDANRRVEILCEL